MKCQSGGEKLNQPPDTQNMQSQNAKMIELAKWIKQDPPGRPVGDDDRWLAWRKQQKKKILLAKINKAIMEADLF